MDDHALNTHVLAMTHIASFQMLQQPAVVEHVPLETGTVAVVFLSRCIPGKVRDHQQSTVPRRFFVCRSQFFVVKAVESDRSRYRRKPQYHRKCQHKTADLNKLAAHDSLFQLEKGIADQTTSLARIITESRIKLQINPSVAKKKNRGLGVCLNRSQCLQHAVLAIRQSGSGIWPLFRVYRPNAAGSRVYEKFPGASDHQNTR
jgi:hypothetical protein